ncbi:MAG: IS200/IS605 family element transposase accessory protein TnpB [Symploca sp. SIO2B6]|nr:IS200/IS605 family element transposase accessory protein TnpB [Symploca sp. SIO2B6]
MLLGFKTELRIRSPNQKIALAKHAGTARHAWNWGLALTKSLLAHNQAYPDDKLKFPTAIDLHVLLVKMVKPQHQWYYKVSKCAPQYALRQLAQAWKQAFNKTRKPPRFKKKGGKDSFTIDGAIECGHYWLKVPKLGKLKTYERLPCGFKPKSVTISRTADRWFVSFRQEIEPVSTEFVNGTVGVDLGVKTLATLSTGETFPGPKSYRQYEKKLARLQWLHRRKDKGSNNWRKAQIKIARLHRRIANIRKNTLHKLTTYLAKNHSQIVIEDLNVSGMLKNGKLAKAISDMGFYEFRRQLEYKCQLYGSKLVVVSRWMPSSKTCSHCGDKKDILSLSERTFECSKCGVRLDRDLNAAINLSHCGLEVSPSVTSGVATAGSLPVSACGPDSADTTRMKQEENVSNC